MGFPLVTTKRVHIRSLIYELLWFLRGDTNVRYLQEHGVTIWDEWADPGGELGPVYGYQWRSWPNPDGTHTDQMSEVLQQIRQTPHSRRHVVVAYNPSCIAQMALAPCHALFQFHVAGGRLSCQLYQRSADVFLGVPFNIASYALLTHMVAQQCDLQVGDFVWTGGDVHLYCNHLDQASLQLSREPYPLPKLALKRRPPDLFSYEYEDFERVGLPVSSGHKGADSRIDLLHVECHPGAPTRVAIHDLQIVIRDRLDRRVHRISRVAVGDRAQPTIRDLVDLEVGVHLSVDLLLQ